MIAPFLIFLAINIAVAGVYFQLAHIIQNQFPIGMFQKNIIFHVFY